MNSFRSRSRAQRSYDLLPPERPKQARVTDRFTSNADIEDAEFVVIAEPSRKTDPKRGRHVKPAQRPGNDNANIRAFPARKPPFGRVEWWSGAKAGLGIGERFLGTLSDNLFSALVALAFLIVFGVTGGFSAIAGFRSDASVRPPVEFTHVSILQRNVNGIPMIVVSGILENHGAEPLSSPTIRANIFAGEVMVSSTVFNPRLGEIDTGTSRGFQVKLPQAGGKMPEVRLSLAK